MINFIDFYKTEIPDNKWQIFSKPIETALMCLPYGNFCGKMSTELQINDRHSRVASIRSIYLKLRKLIQLILALGGRGVSEIFVKNGYVAFWQIKDKLVVKTIKYKNVVIQVRFFQILNIRYET